MAASGLNLRRALGSEEKATAESEAARAEVKQKEGSFAATLAQLKQQHTQTLADKTQIMRDPNDNNLAELRRTCERAAEGDRAKVRLEIKNESNKHAFETHREELEQLTKARRYTEGLRERLSDRDSAARTSSALLDDVRRRAASLEDRLREAEASHVAGIRNKDYKIAVLEVQLHASKGA